MDQYMTVYKLQGEHPLASLGLIGETEGYSLPADLGDWICQSRRFTAV
jgi:hypothetical protein